MAAISALAKLLKNPKTARFAESLNHADLPADWATDPEVVRLAKATYKELGTDSPFFRAWEKAVGSADNAGGVADNVYHGSRANFDTFNTAAGRTLDNVRDAVRSPIFFSPEEDFARMYAAGNAPGNGKVRVYNGWVRAKKTFDYDNPEQLKEVLDNLKTDGYERKIFLRNTIPYGAWKSIEGPEVQKALKDLGYDSYRTYEGKQKNIAIFDPRQFKSVKNQGTFNPNDPNMYKGLLPLAAAGGAIAAMSPNEAEAANISALKSLLANPKTATFVKSLNHADLPKGWADDPEIVSMAEAAYKEMGTDSPFFRAWFQGSKVTDANGTPLEVYHGTKVRKDFDEFSKDKIGKGASKGKNLYGDGFYFTPDYYSAQTFGKNIKDAYLNIKNPSISGNVKPGNDGIAVNAGFHPTYVAFEPTQIKSVHNRGTFNPDDPNIYKGLLPLISAGGAAAALAPGQAQASIPAEQYVWPADKPGWKNTEPGLGSPIVDPVDIITAPIGMTTAAGKAAAMAAEPFVATAADKAINGLLGLFQRKQQNSGGGW